MLVCLCEIKFIVNFLLAARCPQLDYEIMTIYIVSIVNLDRKCLWFLSANASGSISHHCLRSNTVHGGDKSATNSMSSSNRLLDLSRFLWLQRDINRHLNAPTCDLSGDVTHRRCAIVSRNSASKCRQMRAKINILVHLAVSKGFP